MPGMTRALMTLPLSHTYGIAGDDRGHALARARR